MGKKRYYLIAVLAGLAVTGCAKTPDQAVVREKGEHGIEGYQEDTEGVQKDTEAADADGGQAAGAENANDAQDGASAGSVQNSADTNGTGSAQGGANAGQPIVGLDDTGVSGTVNALAQKLQAPQVYETEVSSDDGTFSLTCDAPVYVPDVEKVPVYQVSQRAFSQEFIDRVTDTFFGDAPVYDSDYIYGETKAEVEERLNMLKGYQANGNALEFYRDVIGLVFEEGAEMSEQEAEEYLQVDIDSLEEVYAEAPETKEKVEVVPALEESGNGSASFFGYVETDGGNYTYRLKRYNSMPMQITIQRIFPELDKNAVGNIRYGPVNGETMQDGGAALEDGGETTQDGGVASQNGGETTQDGAAGAESEGEIGIAKEEAIRQANGYLEALGLAGEISCREVQPVTGFFHNFSEEKTEVAASGWQVDCTRDIDGVPVTMESNMGGGVESMDSTTEPWSYETVSFIIGKDGLLQAEICNLYDVGERRMENVQMLAFPEIKGIFEQMLRIKNADMTYKNWIRYKIDRVTLGYMRVYDPTVDNTTGTLVPVWDFFGSYDEETAYEGETYTDHHEYPDDSFLTVNAADGTIIDRGLGY